MKVILWSLMISLIVHIIFFLVIFLSGIQKTMNYQPNMNNAWEDATNLNSSVAFGTINSPLLTLGSFLLVAFISYIIILFIKKLAGKSN